MNTRYDLNEEPVERRWMREHVQCGIKYWHDALLLCKIVILEKHSVVMVALPNWKNTMQY